MRETIGRSLRDRRLQWGQSQAEVAARAGTSQSAIAVLEADRGNPTLSTVQAAARSLGLRVALLPQSPVDDAADAMAASRDDVTALRIGFDLLDRLREVDDEQFALITVIAPAPTGASRYDALLAALVAQVARERSLPAAAWTNDPDRTAVPFWWTSPYPSAAAEGLVHGPPEFRVRGIIITPQDLLRA